MAKNKKALSGKTATKAIRSQRCGCGTKTIPKAGTPGAQVCPRCNRVFLYRAI